VPARAWKFESSPGHQKLHKMAKPTLT